MGDRLWSYVTIKLCNDWRVELGLEKTSFGKFPYRKIHGKPTPTLYAYGSIISPKPKEYKVGFLEKTKIEYRYYVNDLSVDELKKIAMDILDRCSEEMWCEEREFRDKWNKEHGFEDRFKKQYSTYTLDEFFKYKGLPTQKEIKNGKESN